MLSEATLQFTGVGSYQGIGHVEHVDGSGGCCRLDTPVFWAQPSITQPLDRAWGNLTRFFHVLQDSRQLPYGESRPVSELLKSGEDMALQEP